MYLIKTLNEKNGPMGGFPVTLCCWCSSALCDLGFISLQMF